MDYKLHKNLDNDIIGQFCKTLPIKLEVDFALVEEQGWGGDHGKDCIKPIISGYLQWIRSRKSEILSSEHLAMHPAKVGVVCIPFNALRELEPPLRRGCVEGREEILASAQSEKGLLQNVGFLLA